MLEDSSGVRFSGVKDFAKVTQGSAGIQDFDTHAPCWNQVKMCVQIRRIPSALRVFSAGTQYFFNRKQRFHGHEISVKKVHFFVFFVTMYTSYIHNSQLFVNFFVFFKTIYIFVEVNLGLSNLIKNTIFH